MSRIGKKPVELPKGVTASTSGQTIEVKGPKGARSFTAGDDVTITIDGAAGDALSGTALMRRMEKTLRGFGSLEALALSIEIPKAGDYRAMQVLDVPVIVVRGKDGNEGIGFCYVGSAGGDIAKIAVEQLLAPKLIGQNSHRSEGLWMEMYNESILQGRAGAVMRGISILDTALWDLNARAAKLPLHQYLGSVVDDRVPAYASGGYYLDGKTPAKLGKEMESYVKQGFKAVKMKVDRKSVV